MLSQGLAACLKISQLKVGTIYCSPNLITQLRYDFVRGSDVRLGVVWRACATTLYHYL